MNNRKSGKEYRGAAFAVGIALAAIAFFIRFAIFYTARSSDKI